MLQQLHVHTRVNLYYEDEFLKCMVQMNTADIASGVVHQYGGITLGTSF